MNHVMASSRRPKGYEFLGLSHSHAHTQTSVSVHGSKVYPLGFKGQSKQQFDFHIKNPTCGMSERNPCSTLAFEIARSFLWLSKTALHLTHYRHRNKKTLNILNYATVQYYHHHTCLCTNPLVEDV
jgi:hypothetical protein